MSTPILKSYVDEHGNISVRVSRDVQVLTREEADLIEAEYKRMQAENAKLRDSLKALIMGTYAELCVDRDQPQCKECVMRHGDESCVVADAMELLEIDVYGEPLGGRR